MLLDMMIFLCVKFPSSLFELLNFGALFCIEFEQLSSQRPLIAIIHQNIVVELFAIAAIATIIHSFFRFIAY